MDGASVALEHDLAAAPKAEVAGVLVICPYASDRERLCEILQPQPVAVYEAPAWREGAEVMSKHAPQVVVCEALLPDASWKEVLERTAALKNSPKLIVISSQADELLWAEVLNLGGYDVLPRPLDREEATRVVMLASQNWRNERDRLGRQAA